ncbi:MAG: DUF481 domain-containing protein [Flavobacteriales bacterium]
MLYKHYTKYLFVFCFFHLFISNCCSQILFLDRENASDTLHRKFTGLIDLTITADKQRKDIIELTQQSEFDWKVKKSNVVILLTHTDFVFNGPVVLENNGYFQIRFRDNDTKKVAPDYFLQYQWNGITGLQNRAIAGLNARFRFWDDRKDDFYSSAGLFYEYEKWNPFLINYAFGGSSLQMTERNLLRLNLSLKTAFQLHNGIDFSFITYLQSPLNAGLKNIFAARWSVDSQINFQLNKHLFFNIKYNHNLDYFRPLPIDVFFYSFTLGCRLLV